MDKLVQFVSNYEDAPEDAKYILRLSNGDSDWIFQEYNNGSQFDLEVFSSITPKNFHNMLKRCRQLAIKSSPKNRYTTIWVEKPFWMYNKNDYQELESVGSCKEIQENAFKVSADIENEENNWN